MPEHSFPCKETHKASDFPFLYLPFLHLFPLVNVVETCTSLSSRLPWGVWRVPEQIPVGLIDCFRLCCLRRLPNQEFECQLFIWEVNLVNASWGMGRWGRKGKETSKGYVIAGNYKEPFVHFKILKIINAYLIQKRYLCREIYTYIILYICFYLFK